MEMICIMKTHTKNIKVSRARDKLSAVFTLLYFFCDVSLLPL